MMKYNNIKRNLINVSAILVISSSLAGCSMDLKRKIDSAIDYSADSLYEFFAIDYESPSSIENVDDMDYLEYGMDIHKINNILGHPGKLLFVFFFDNKKYLVTLNQIPVKKKNYLFLYENNLLVSVFEPTVGETIWRNTFGQYKKSLPDPDKFGIVVKHLKNNKISLDYILSDESISDTSSTYKDPGLGGTLVEASIIYSWIPGVSQILAGTGVVLMASKSAGEDSINYEDNYDIDDDDDFSMMISKDYYKKLLKKYEHVNVDASSSDIIRSFNMPNIKTKHNKTTLFVYSDTENTIFGFTQEKLRWVAINYPIKVKKSYN